MPPRQRKGKTSEAMRKQSGAKPIPPVSQLPPVGELDTFLHHKSGCKKASTYGKTHFAFGCGGQKARHFRIYSRVPSIA